MPDRGLLLGYRAGQYRKATSIERFGSDMSLPDLRVEIAQCGRHGKMHDVCGVNSSG